MKQERRELVMNRWLWGIVYIVIIGAFFMFWELLASLQVHDVNKPLTAEEINFKIEKRFIFYEDVKGNCYSIYNWDGTNPQVNLIDCDIPEEDCLEIEE